MEGNVGRERRAMDAADQLIVRYALGQRRDKLPKDLASLLDNPTWSSQDLMDALHERVSREPDLGQHFIHLLAHHPHSARSAGHGSGHAQAGVKPGSVRNGTGREGEKFHLETEMALNLKRESLIAKVEEAFFPETVSEERIDLDYYIKLMQALGLTKSIRGLKGIERDFIQHLKIRQ